MLAREALSFTLWVIICFNSALSGGLELPYKHGMKIGRSLRLSNGKVGADLFPENELAQNMIVQRLDRLNVNVGLVKSFSDVKRILKIFGGELLEETGSVRNLEGPGKEYLQRKPRISSPQMLEVLVNLEHNLWVESLGKDAILHFPSDRRLIGQYYVDSLTHGGQLVVSFIWHLKDGIRMSKVEKTVRDLVSKSKNGNDLSFLVEVKESLRQETRMIMINSFASKGIPRPLVHFGNIQKVIKLFKSAVAKMNDGRGVAMRATLTRIPEIALTSREKSRKRPVKTKGEVERAAEVIKKSIKSADLQAAEGFYRELKEAQVTFIGLVQSLNKTLGTNVAPKGFLNWKYDKEIAWITKEKKLISAEIKALKKDFLDVKQQLQKYTKKKVSETDFEPDVLEQLYKMMNKLTEIEKDLKDQKGKCKKLVPKSWFTATLTGSWDREDETIIYDSVTHNHGHLYDNATGIITAPEDGLYAITYVISSTNNITAVVEMKKSRKKSKVKDTEDYVQEELRKSPNQIDEKDQSDEASTVTVRSRNPRAANWGKLQGRFFPRRQVKSTAKGLQKTKHSFWRRAVQKQNDGKRSGKSRKSRSRKPRKGKSKTKRHSQKKRGRGRKKGSKRSRGSKSKRRGKKYKKHTRRGDRRRKGKKKENSKKSSKATKVEPLKVIKKPLIINIDGSNEPQRGQSSRNSVLLALGAGDKVWMELKEGILQSSETAKSTLSAILLKVEDLD